MIGPRQKEGFIKLELIVGGRQPLAPISDLCKGRQTTLESDAHIGRLTRKASYAGKKCLVCRIIRMQQLLFGGECGGFVCDQPFPIVMTSEQIRFRLQVWP